MASFFGDIGARFSDFRVQASDRFKEVIAAEKAGLIATAEKSIRDAGTNFQRSIVGAFRGSKTGQALEKTATEQKVREVLNSPLTWLLGGIVLIGLAFGLRSMARGK